jgi:hypothetical protein
MLLQCTNKADACGFGSGRHIFELRLRVGLLTCEDSLLEDLSPRLDQDQGHVQHLQVRLVRLHSPIHY